MSCDHVEKHLSHTLSRLLQVLLLCGFSAYTHLRSAASHAITLIAPRLFSL
jgi:hypothetical protein